MTLKENHCFNAMIDSAWPRPKPVEAIARRDELKASGDLHREQHHRSLHGQSKCRDAGASRLRLHAIFERGHQYFTYR